jgi:hypothetical protein
MLLEGSLDYQLEGEVHELFAGLLGAQDISLLTFLIIF